MATKHCVSEDQERLERYLVGGLLATAAHEPELVGDALALVPGDAVRTLELDVIWRAVDTLHRAGKDVTLLTVFDALHENFLNGKGPNVSALSLGELCSTVFAYRDAVMFHALELNKLHRRMRLQETLMAMSGECMTHGADPDDIAARTLAAIESIRTPKCSETLDGLLDDVLADVESGQGARPLPTPWANLNTVLKGGTAPGELVVLAGRPGLGKTAFAGCMAVETARKVGPVLFVSCEVRDRTIGARLLAREGRIDNRSFRQGLGSGDGQLAQMRKARASLAGIPLRVVDSSNRMVRPAEVRKLARQLGDKPALVVVDYLQLMYPDEKTNSREQEIAGMSRAMKRLAVELNCPVWLLSQLNRKVEDANRKPELADLRESGAVEQDADIVIMLHSDRKNQALTKTPVEALVRKGRSSGTGVAYLIFDKPYANFCVDDHAEAWRERCQTEAPKRQENDF